MTSSVRQIYDDRLIDPVISDFGLFEKHLKETLATGQPRWFHWLGERGRITDTIAELSGWYCFSEAYLEAERNRESRRAAGSLPGGDLAPVRLPPKVGRNDPCPCGSGKKFKKCCLP